MAMGSLVSLLSLLLAVEGLKIDSLPQQVHIAATGKSLVYCRDQCFTECIG